MRRLWSLSSHSVGVVVGGRKGWHGRSWGFADTRDDPIGRLAGICLAGMSVFAPLALAGCLQVVFGRCCEFKSGSQSMVLGAWT